LSSLFEGEHFIISDLHVDSVTDAPVCIAA
jgi:hypothetical protein